MRNYLWITCIIFCAVCYEFSKCFLKYNPNHWSFEFENSDFCDSLIWYSDFLFNTGIDIITLFLNLLTAYKGRKQSRVLINAAGLKVSAIQRRREWNFVKQTCFQGLSIFTGQVAFYFVAPVIDADWVIAQFIAATFWVFIHAAEGWVSGLPECLQVISQLLSKQFQRNNFGV